MDGDSNRQSHFSVLHVSIWVGIGSVANTEFSRSLVALMQTGVLTTEQMDAIGASIRGYKQEVLDAAEVLESLMAEPSPSED